MALFRATYFSQKKVGGSDGIGSAVRVNGVRETLRKTRSKLFVSNG